MPRSRRGFSDSGAASMALPAAASEESIPSVFEPVGGLWAGRCPRGWPPLTPCLTVERSAARANPPSRHGPPAAQGIVLQPHRVLVPLRAIVRQIGDVARMPQALAGLRPSLARPRLPPPRPAARTPVRHRLQHGPKASLRPAAERRRRGFGNKMVTTLAMRTQCRYNMIMRLFKRVVLEFKGFKRQRNAMPMPRRGRPSTLTGW
jgi:hypothetical protein